MHRNYLLEQWVKLFLELGCPMPVDIETVIVCDGRKNELSPCQRVEEVDVWLDGGARPQRHAPGRVGGIVRS